MIALLSVQPIAGRSVPHFVAWSCLELAVKLARHGAVCTCGCRYEHFGFAIDDAAEAAATAHDIERQHHA